MLTVEWVWNITVLFIYMFVYIFTNCRYVGISTTALPAGNWGEEEEWFLAWFRAWLSHLVVDPVYTVRKFNWWRHCLMLSSLWRSFQPFSLYFTKLYVPKSFAIGSSVPYSEILQNFSNSVEIQSLSLILLYAILIFAYIQIHNLYTVWNIYWWILI